MKRLLAALVGLALVLVGTVAVAAWLSTGSASATVTATTVDQANAPSATRGSGSVTLSWTASTLANGSSVGGYRVVRHDGSTSATVCTAISPVTSCTDTDPVGGAVTYGVIATVGTHWVGAESSPTSFTYDVVKPNTTASISPQPNTAGWNKASVTVTLTATDPAISSGLDHVTYTVDGGAAVDVPGDTASFAVTGTGTHTVTYSAVDKAGNAEATKSTTVRIDPDAPLITNLQPATGAAGAWSAIRCGGANRVCADVSDVTSGIATSAVTFSLTGTSGANNGKCWNGSAFVTGPCAQQPMSALSGNTYGSATALSAAAVSAGGYSMVVTATDVADNVSTSTSTFTVKADQTISFTSTAPSNATVGGATSTVSATATSGLTVSFSSATPSVCSVSGSTISFLATGTCTINADQAGNATYNAAPQVQQSFTVKANQTIAFAQPTSPATATTSASLSASSTSGLAVTITSATTSVCTVTGTTVSYLTSGSCILNANQAGDSTYNAAAQVQRTVTVNKATQTITFDQPTSPASAGSTATLSATSSSGLAVSFSTTSSSSICTISGTTVTYVGAGSCVITASQSGNATYSAATQVQRTVTVVPAFAITGRTSTSPQNTTKVTGTGNPGATVSVYVCSGSRTSCGPGDPNLVSATVNFSNPETGTVQSDGTWLVTFSKLVNGAGTFTIQAVQSSPSQTSSVVVFTTS